MDDLFRALVLLSLGILVVYVNDLGKRLRRVERSLHAVLHEHAPSEAVRALAADPERKIDAIRLYRVETGADVGVAAAVIRSLRHERSVRVDG